MIVAYEAYLHLYEQNVWEHNLWRFQYFTNTI